MRVTTPAAAGLLALSVLMLPPAFGDDGADVYEDEVANEPRSLAPEDLSDEQLERYVEAEQEVAAIRLRHADEIASRGTETAEEAQNEMAAAIEDHGLTVREYREIAHLAQNDAMISKRVKRIETRGR